MIRLCSEIVRKKSGRIRQDTPIVSQYAHRTPRNNVGALAEREQHHPDLHFVGYRTIWIELMTHAIGGLSENDFILAAKIDAMAPPAAQ